MFVRPCWSCSDRHKSLIIVNQALLQSTVCFILTQQMVEEFRSHESSSVAASQRLNCRCSRELVSMLRHQVIKAVTAHLCVII